MKKLLTIDDNKHMTWQVAPIDKSKLAKVCAFSIDGKAVLVATEDGRFFKAPFEETGEMQGAALLTG